MPGLQRQKEGGTIPRAPNHDGGAEPLQGAPKFPNSVTITFFNTVYLLPKYSTSVSNMGCQTCFLPRAPSYLVTSLQGYARVWCNDRLYD